MVQICALTAGTQTCSECVYGRVGMVCMVLSGELEAVLQGEEEEEEEEARRRIQLLSYLPA